MARKMPTHCLQCRKKYITLAGAEGDVIAAARKLQTALRRGTKIDYYKSQFDKAKSTLDREKRELTLHEASCEEVAT